MDFNLGKPGRYTAFLLNLYQNVYFVAYPRSAQAYGDARTPTWLNQEKISTFV